MIQYFGLVIITLLAAAAIMVGVLHNYKHQIIRRKVARALSQYGPSSAEFIALVEKYHKDNLLKIEIEECVHFIRSARKHSNDKEIETTLKNVGWPVAKIKEAFSEAGKKEEKVKEHTKKGSHHLFHLSPAKVADEVIFVLGIIFFIVGFVETNYYFVLGGIGIMIITMYLLHGEVKKDELEIAIQKEEHHERQMVSKIRSILKKEHKLKAREEKLKQQVAELFTAAGELRKKEAALKERWEKEHKKKYTPVKEVKEAHVSSKELHTDVHGHPKDVAVVLKSLDHLMDKLPQEEVDKFAKSKEFKTYEKVMGSLK